MTGREALADELVERVLHGRHVQPHDVAEQIGEARARRASAALDVDHGAREVEVVARLVVELRLRDGWTARAAARPPPPCRRRRSRAAVRQREHGRLEGGVGFAQCFLACRQAVAQLGRGRDLRCRVAARALGLADRLRGGVALGAQLVDLGLQGAPALVEGQAPRRAGRRPGGAPAPRARARSRCG